MVDLMYDDDLVWFRPVEDSLQTNIDIHNRIDRSFASSYFALRPRSCSSGTDRANITERVVVPSCEHVAEIVGRQGRRIKRLRDITKTYIRTPTRLETPVFTVTGRSADVSDAKRQILLASAQFDKQLKQRVKLDNCLSNNIASRSKRDLPPITNYVCTDVDFNCDVTRGASLAKYDVIQNHVMSLITSRDVTRRHSLFKNDVTEDHMTSLITSSDVIEDRSVVIVRVPVPYRCVGLIVGCRGETIKRIQHDTATHVISPDKLQTEPVFVVSGRLGDVERARQRIERCVLSDKRLTVAEAGWDKSVTIAEVDWGKRVTKAEVDWDKRVTIAEVDWDKRVTVPEVDWDKRVTIAIVDWDKHVTVPEVDWDKGGTIAKEDWNKLTKITGVHQLTCESKEGRNSDTNELISLLACNKLS